MTIQIVSMKYTGQQLIADVGEVYNSKEAKEEGERPICMSFSNPYVLEIETQTENGYNLRISKWNPFTDETSFNIGFDLIGTLHEPKEGIRNAYVERLQADAPQQKVVFGADNVDTQIDSTLTPTPGVAEMLPEFSEETEVNLTPVEDEETVESV